MIKSYMFHPIHLLEISFALRIRHLGDFLCTYRSFSAVFLEFYIPQENHFRSSLISLF